MNTTSSFESTTSLNGQIPQLWMGELDQRWDELTIKQIWNNLLNPLGIVIHSIKLIKDKQSTILGLANAGYCFIRFHNFDDATKVLNTFNGKVIPNTNNLHYFRLNWSSANIQAAANSIVSNTTIPTTNQPLEYSIFVGDLPQNINENILLQTFKSKYPSCTNVKIMIDQTTGNIKGYGFVKFLNEEEQQRALVEMQGYVLLGRAIRVSTASKSNNTNNNTVTNNSNNSISNAISSPPRSISPAVSLPLSTESSSVNLNLTQPLPQSTPLQYFNDPSNTTVFIGGLNIPFTEKQMFDLFSKFGSISYVKIPQGKNCGFVQYFLRQSAEMAIIEMQGYDIGGGCKIRVSWGAKAAQRSWFARQLQMQQLEDQQSNQFNPQAQVQVQSHAQAQVQAQQAAQLQAQAQAQAQVQLQAQLQTQLQSQLQLQQHQQHQSLLGLDFSNSDINTLLNMSKNQNMSNNLGLYDSFDNSGIINNNNKNYSTTTGFQNDLIPFNSMNMGMNNYPNDELKLNKLLIAARDGNLDQLELGSNLYN